MQSFVGEDVQESINLLVSTYYDNIDDIMDCNPELGSKDNGGQSGIDLVNTIEEYLPDKEKMKY